MAVLGDRELAGLLSSIAEAPDFPAATSHLLAQLADITAARRAVMLKIDAAQHSLVVVAANGFDPPPAFSISLGDLSSPLVICALSLLPIRGESELGPRALEDMVPWVVVPMSQPLQRGSLEVMNQERAAELVSSRSASILSPFDRRVATSPAGVRHSLGGSRRRRPPTRRSS